MKKVIIFCFIIFTKFSFSQHTESYMAIANNFKIVDSSKVELKWKNGKIKERKKTIKLIHNNTEYKLLTGVHEQFNRKGIKRTESLFDKYGNYLSYKFFDLDGNIITEIVTLKIDYTHNQLLEITKEYTDYMEYKGEIYRYKTGKKCNNKKIGKWFTYDSCGNIIKEKNYSK